MRSRARTGTALSVLAIAVIAGVAARAQQPAMGPAPGRLIDVGGYKLHIGCAGEGAPTVVIDGGAGAWSIHYAHIQKALSGVRVCTYDRAGFGWSDAGPSPRTSERMVEELHALLHGAGVAPPLVLVGHSLGGYNVRIYQARYPEEVGAIVLLDAAHEQQWDRLPPQARELTRASVAGLRKRAEQARQGQLRTDDITPAGVFVTRSPQLRDSYVAAMLTGKPYEAQAAETEASFESARQVPARHRLGNLPLVVLTARRSFDAFKGSGIPVEESNAAWLALQKELASLSDNSRHLFTDGHHRLHETDPDAIVSAIQHAINAVKIRPAARGSRPPRGTPRRRRGRSPRSAPQAVRRDRGRRMAPRRNRSRSVAASGSRGTTRAEDVGVVVSDPKQDDVFVGDCVHHQQLFNQFRLRTNLCAWRRGR